jgi:uncharacterized protein
MKTATDPRPDVVQGPEGARLLGQRCPACGYVAAVRRPWCPECRAALEAAEFGPRGVVWSSTVVRIPVPGRTPPYTLAYVDLKDGPRVLAHVVDVQDPVPIGTEVDVVAREGEADVHVEVVS